MLEVFRNWIDSPLVQSLLLSPLMGVIFGALFSGLNNSPSRNDPMTVKETVRIYKERIIYREKERKADTSDPVSIAIAFALIVMFLTWNYVLHSETILSGLFILLLTIVCFFLTISVLSLIKGQFTDRSWWNSTVFPMLLLCSCFYLLFCAKARSRSKGGSGLGLAIAKAIALAHNGSLDVRSEIVKGSVFILKLPKYN